MDGIGDISTQTNTRRTHSTHIQTFSLSQSQCVQLEFSAVPQRKESKSRFFRRATWNVYWICVNARNTPNQIINYEFKGVGLFYISMK